MAELIIHRYMWFYIRNNIWEPRIISVGWAGSGFRCYERQPTLVQNISGWELSIWVRDLKDSLIFNFSIMNQNNVHYYGVFWLCLYKIWWFSFQAFDKIQELCNVPIFQSIFSFLEKKILSTSIFESTIENHFSDTVKYKLQNKIGNKIHGSLIRKSSMTCMWYNQVGPFLLIVTPPENSKSTTISIRSHLMIWWVKHSIS